MRWVGGPLLPGGARTIGAGVCNLPVEGPRGVTGNAGVRGSRWLRWVEAGKPSAVKPGKRAHGLDHRERSRALCIAVLRLIVKYLILTMKNL